MRETRFYETIRKKKWWERKQLGTCSKGDFQPLKSIKNQVEKSSKYPEAEVICHSVFEKGIWIAGVGSTVARGTEYGQMFLVFNRTKQMLRIPVPVKDISVHYRARSVYGKFKIQL